MFARLRERFWKWVYGLAERRWDRAHDDAHPDQGPTDDAGGYRWVVEDVAYAPVWSPPDSPPVDGEPIWSERSQWAAYTALKIREDARRH
jgi:hypothetical protein